MFDITFPCKINKVSEMSIFVQNFLLKEIYEYMMRMSKCIDTAIRLAFHHNDSRITVSYKCLKRLTDA